ncbi:MAG: DUF4466 family protein [Paraprevotella sp.]|nr:DUF4466 family protein [Paraprevotella sp.]
MRIYKKIIGCLLLSCIVGAFTASCEDDAEPILKNDCLKRTLGSNVVGEEIYFAYAMAVPYGAGRIESAQVEASIAGAEGTYLENNSYHTDENGVDTPVLVGDSCVTEGKVSTVKFTVETCAATLRYYYKIPEEARGKTVTFRFSARSAAGETVYTEMGPYTISSMDMKRNLALTKAKCYISIEDMAVYNATDAAEHPEKIDLVYMWRSSSRNPGFGHSFVAPAADPEYLPDIELPAGVNRDAKIRKEWGMIDSHLTSEPNNGTYIDDVDFQTMDFTNKPDYAINMKKQGELWVETQDGKYRAFIYINDLKTISGGTISMKRYTMY